MGGLHRTVRSCHVGCAGAVSTALFAVCGKALWCNTASASKLAHACLAGFVVADGFASFPLKAVGHWMPEAEGHVAFCSQLFIILLATLVSWVAPLIGFSWLLMSLRIFCNACLKGACNWVRKRRPCRKFAGVAATMWKQKLFLRRPQLVGAFSCYTLCLIWPSVFMGIICGSVIVCGAAMVVRSLPSSFRFRTRQPFIFVRQDVAT